MRLANSVTVVLRLLPAALRRGYECDRLQDSGLVRHPTLVTFRRWPHELNCAETYRRRLLSITVLEPCRMCL